MTSRGTPDRSTPVVLADPVRQRLLQVAAEVLGRMPAEEVPPTLRPIARFTPAKRVRLGATALSAALDADPDFRKRVADALADASPQLVDAVQNGEPTTASDPLDTAVVAYLTRPDGWTELVAEVTERWTSEHSAREAAVEETARLRAELAELRARLKANSAELDGAVAAATAAVSEETTRLRNLLRTRTGELRGAERAAENARRDLDAARAELADARAKHEAALAGLRARVQDLERAGESARRDARTGREVADAKLRLLLDTMTEAAAGLRRELALPAGTLRPADTLGTGEHTTRRHGGATRAPDLDRLLELPQVHVIIDGYNVTKTGYGDLPLADQRSRLIAALAALQARCGGEITVVFDGGARPPAQPRTPRGIRVLFSAPDEIADDLIRRLVAAEPAGRPLVVVTSDRAIVTDVTRAGAWTVPSAALVERLG